MASEQRERDDGTSSYDYGWEDGRRAGLEEAARICDNKVEFLKGCIGSSTARELANTIRARIGQGGTDD